jgi:hypothetical protein
MGKSVFRKLRGGDVPEHTVRTAPENAARALTVAEADARRRLAAIRIAEETAKAELAARQKQ